MKNLSVKNRKKRSRETLYKGFLLFFAIVSAAGVRLYLTEKTPLPAFQGNGPVVTDLLNEEASETEPPRREPLREDLEKKKINLNSATLEDLQRLPGIGGKTARKIVEYKEKNGRYRSIEEMMEVKGIGPKKFQKIKSFISTD